MKVKLPFFLLTVLVVLMFTSTKIFAQIIWNGSSDVSWYDATLTSYDIYTAEELAGVAQLVNNNTTDFSGKTINLQSDIWLNANISTANNWIPIGGNATASTEDQGTIPYFRGNFNGNYHTIYNLYCNKSNYYQAGFFGAIKDNITIENIALINPTVTSRGMMGALIGLADDGTIYIKNSIIINAVITGTGNNNIGCFLGANWMNSNQVYIERCAATGTVSGNYTGGFSGNSNRVNYSYCYFAGSVTGGVNANAWGGFTGYSGNIDNATCFSNIGHGTEGLSGTQKTDSYMQSADFIADLDSTFKMDICNLNSGYPIKNWQMCGIPIEGTLEICLGESTTLTASGFTSYLWNNGSTSNSITVSPTNTTQYFVTGTNSQGDMISDTVTVTVYPQAIINSTIDNSYDGLTHGTVTPISTTIPCGSTNLVPLTITPDMGWHISSIMVNGNQVRGSDASDGAVVNYAIDPQGTLANVRVLFHDKYRITSTITLTDGTPLNEPSLINHWGNNGVYETIGNTDVVYTFNETGRYHITDVEINGISQGIITTYTFTNLNNDDNTIHVYYEDNCGINTLPYSENFDIYALNSYPDCWFRLSSYSNSYPQIQSANSTSQPGGSLNFYAGYSNFTTAVTPLIDATIPTNALQVSFALRCSNLTSTFEVGVMSDPSDDNTFVSLALMHGTAVNVWENHVVYLNQYTGNGHYIAFRFSTASYSTANLDNISIDYIPDCSPVLNLSASILNGSSIVLNWDPNVIGSSVGYNINYYIEGTQNYTTEYTDSTNITIVGLDENTSYLFEISTDCGAEGSSNPTTILIKTPCHNPAEVLVGNSSNETGGNLFPFNPYYNYSYTQQIFTASNLGNTPHDFVGISLQYFPSNTITRNIDIFLAHITDSVFLSNSSWIPGSTFTHLFSGNVTFDNTGTNHWFYIAFDSTFSYNGTDNLVLAVVDNTGSYTNTNNQFYTHQGVGNCSISTSTDGSHYNPSTPPTLGSLSSIRNNVQFVFCGGSTCIRPSNLSINTLNSTEVFLSWLAGGLESQWEVEYRDLDDGTWMSFGITSVSNVNITNLLPFHTYEVRVRSVCGNTEVSPWCPSVSFETPRCDAIVRCDYSLTMNDEYGDGWNGNSISFMIDGVQIGNYTLANGSTQTINVTLCSGDSIELVWNEGSYAYETSFTLTDPFGETVLYSCNDGSGLSNNTVFYSFVTSCTSPSCTRPINLSAENFTTAGATISWTDNNPNAAEWIVEYGPTGFMLGTGTVETVYSNPFVINSLNPNTAYDIYIRTFCGAGDTSILSSKLTFITACGEISSLPYSENFDQGIINQYLNCWSRYASNFDHMVYVYSGNNNTCVSMPNSMDFHYTPNCNTIAITPQISNIIPLNTLSVSFWCQRTGTSAVFEIGAMTDPNDASTFAVIDTIEAPNVNEWYDLMISLADYMGIGQYIAFKVSNGVNCGFRIDDVVIDYTPSCIHPNQLMANNITAHTSDLTWNERGTATSWNIEYGPSGFIPGTGTIENSVTNPVTITGLTGTTNYQFYVQANCIGGSSQWSGPYEFRTGCAAVTIPHTENFDSYSTWEIPECWTKLESANMTGVSYIANGENVSPNNSLMFNTTSGSTDYYGYARLCEFDITNINSLSISFSAKKEYGGRPLMIGVLTDPTDVSTLTKVDSITNATNSWTEYLFSLGSYTGNGRYLVIGLPTGYDDFSSYYIDNIVVDLIPSCIYPNNLTTNGITTNSAELAWNERGSATSWNIEYGPEGFIQGTGTMVTANSNPFILNNLSTNTMYDWYVQSNCGNGDISQWVGPFTFTTECNALTAPYTEDFEGTNLPSCWSMQFLSGDETPWTFGVSGGSNDMPANAYHGSNNAMFFLGSYTTAITKLISPTLDITGLANPGLSFAHAQSAWGSDYDILRVYYKNSNASEWTLLVEYPDAIEEWTVDTILLPNPTTTYKIAFEGTTDYGYGIVLDDIHIDNFIITEPCNTPTNLTAVPNANSAVISWNEGGNESQWIVDYKQSNAQNWTSATVNGNPNYTIIGLMENTSYSVRVKALCSNNNESNYTSEFIFTTSEQTTSYTITATASGPGTINPIGIISIQEGEDAVFTIIPDNNASVATLLVDGFTTNTPSNLVYTFDNVVTNHTIDVTFANGIQDNDYDHEITIYPNPAEESIEISFSNSKWINQNVALFDMYGKQITSSTLSNTHIIFDIKNLSSGVYFIYFTSPTGNIVKRFVKK